MRFKFMLPVLLALSLSVAALVHGRALFRCHAADATPATTEISGASDCCYSNQTDCLQTEFAAAAPEQARNSSAQQIDPGRQIVLKVQGLTCPAVKGIGCGHMLQGVLASLNKIEGVEASSANYTGTLIRISVTHATDRERVAEAVSNVLAAENRSPATLTGDELKLALDREQWREENHIGELSAIEFHTLALHRVKTFAKAAQLDKTTTEKLVKIAEQQWDRISKEVNAAGATRPEDWGKRIKASLPFFLEHAKELLTTEQLDRFKHTLTERCAGDVCPEAPPASAGADKAAYLDGFSRSWPMTSTGC